MRRFLGVTAIALVVVLVLGLGAGGWYYTDQLLPAPQPDEPDYAVEVVASDEEAGTVTLAVPDGGDLVELTRLGFWTDTGTVELGEVTATTGADPGTGGQAGDREAGDREAGDGEAGDDATVTRTATLLDGEWPTAGTRGMATATTYRGDPQEALGLRFETIDVAGPDGVLPAWFVPGDDAATDADAGTVAVMVHGRGATREELHRSLRTVNAAGLDALVVSVRNDPDAPADPDGWGRFGDTEWEDLQVAVDHLVEEREVEHLFLVGSSQGGSIVLSWLRRGEHTDRAVGAFLTSPLVSMHDTLVLQAQGRGIPDAVIPPLLWSTKIQATLRSGMRFDRLEHAADDVVDAYDVPMLITHGSGDTTVPHEGSRRLAEARPDLVTYEEYDGVEHVREWNADPDRFDEDLRAFLATLQN